MLLIFLAMRAFTIYSNNTFKCTIQLTRVTMLYVASPDVTHPITKSLFPLAKTEIHKSVTI